MSTNLQTQSRSDGAAGGGVWYELHSEREEICEVLLRPAPTPDQLATRVGDNELLDRLRLIDDALDRLMAGTYGDCVVCGRWIEDNKLHVDPALPFCCGCQRRLESKHINESLEIKSGGVQPCFV